MSSSRRDRGRALSAATGSQASAALSAAFSCRGKPPAASLPPCPPCTLPSNITQAERRTLARSSRQEGGSKAVAALRSARSAAAGPSAHENVAAAANPQQPQASPLARHAAAVQDAMLMHSFNAAVAAAGHSDSSWLNGTDTAIEEDVQGASSQLPSPSTSAAAQQHARFDPSSSSSSSGGGPASPTALLLPHLQSPEATSWLTGGSPTHRCEAWQLWLLLPCFHLLVCCSPWLAGQVN